MSWPDRLKAARSFYGASQEEMAARLEVPYRTYQGYEAGASEPKAKMLTRLVDLGFSGSWILTGDGEMRADASEGLAALTDQKLQEAFANIQTEEALRRRQFSVDGPAITEDMLQEFGIPRRREAIIKELERRAPPANPAATLIDEEVNGRLLEAVAAVYAECGVKAGPREWGRVAAEIYNDVATVKPKSREAWDDAIQIAALQLRRRLQAANQAAGGGAQGKQSA